jgi:hypothetical protein
MTEQNINSEIKRIQNAIEDAYNKGDSHTYIAVGPTDAYKQFSNYCVWPQG